MDASKQDLIAAAAFLAGAGVMALESMSEVYVGSGAGVAQNAVFYPRIVLGIIAVLALLLAARALFAPAAARPIAPPQGAVAGFRWRTVLLMMAAAIAYTALMHLIGYLAATLIFVALTPPLLGFRRWRMLALTVLLFPLGSWLLFVHVIQIPLPAGHLPGLG